MVKSGNGFGPEMAMKSINSPWWNGGVGRKSDESNLSSSPFVFISWRIGTGICEDSCSNGDVVPPIGPSFGSRRERSAASRSGYISRVKYEAEGGSVLLGLSGPLP